jgi:hypothetical protein
VLLSVSLCPGFRRRRRPAAEGAVALFPMTRMERGKRRRRRRRRRGGG